MKFDEIKQILRRLYKDHVNRYLNRIFLSLFLSIIVSAATSSIAWLLDPAVKKIFIDNDRTFAALIPIAIIIVFAAKGVSLYLARNYIIVLGFRVVEEIQSQMAKHVLLSDTQNLESKHTGKYIANFMYDVGQIQTLISTGVLNLMKDIVRI